MKVRCHCSAPPSHPPSAKAFGQWIKSFCGIFAPQLGNARKICSPLPTSTNSDIEFTQWQSLTMNGCSYTASVTSPVFASSISIARVAMFNSVLGYKIQLQTVEFRIALVFPIPNLLQHASDLKIR